MTLIICPGIHPPELTESFVESIKKTIGERKYLIFPSEESGPYSAIAILQWLKIHYPSPLDAPPLSFISFSAGVVGSMGAAIAWQLQGGRINNFIAFDGWGMPLIGNFPLYRVSHDRFTHYTSALLGGGKKGFYVDPEVEHLTLWRSPDTCRGWYIISPGLKTRCSLLEYLNSRC
ncbi:hypothetical protein I4641_08070 [Waterburya agarophytonicola K14]|uniref:Uncharacterized protein n=1 Tax=Waterburya agarophytonicola KI4 TaxID=2874699 RepID=A0A964BPK5_9CYAN|nr:hypothetical protein [Waterburya agarophytonicola]MCC0176934.1 hypothetical protein [Waterburya agarophytonicola KI4]